MSGLLTQDQFPNYFCLHSHVVPTNGSRGGALYDLRNSRILPIPSSACRILGFTEHWIDVPKLISSVDGAENRVSVAAYLRDLAAHNYGRFSEIKTEATAVEFQVREESLSQLSRVSIEVPHLPGRTANQRIKNLISEASLSFGCTEFHLHIFGAAARRLEELYLTLAMQDLPFPIPVINGGDHLPKSIAAISSSIEKVIVHHEGFLHRSIVPGLCNAELCYELNDVRARRVSRHSFECSYEHYKLLQVSSVDRGKVYVDREGGVWPTWREKHYKICQIADTQTQFSRIFANPRLLKYWYNGRSSITECKSCEFRNCCTNSPSNRQRATDISSAPDNCDLAPDSRKESLSLQHKEHDDELKLVFEIGRLSVFAAKQDMAEVSSCREIYEKAMESASDLIGGVESRGRIEYVFSPNLLSSRTESLRIGDQDVTATKVYSPYICHVHEIMHALLNELNPQPTFFPAEAGATMLGLVWVSSAIRTSERNGAVRKLKSGRTVVGQMALWLPNIASPDQDILDLDEWSNTHEIARSYIASGANLMTIRSCFRLREELGMPSYIYEMGGSFFLYLIEKFGYEKFREFYAGDQSVEFLQLVFKVDIDRLELEWRQQLMSKES